MTAGTPSTASLHTLPPPPAGRTGWPWTEAHAAADAPPAGGSWPRITIVTPSYNQGAYIEETIRSVLLQGYPELEYIVMDGGSTDDTVEILRRYEPWLSHWQSGPDDGQSDAIATGFERASGDVLAWLCSDDCYLPGALEFAAVAHLANPNAALLCGQTNLDQGTGWAEWMAMRYAEAKPTYARLVASGQCIQQPGCFWTRDAYRRTVGVDRTLDFCMDYDLLVKLCLVGEAVYSEREVAWMRMHAASKSSTMHATRVAEHGAIVERALAAHPIAPCRLCLINYMSTVRRVYRNDRLGVSSRLAWIARLLGGFALRAARGHVRTWHPVRGYGDTPTARAEIDRT